MVREVIHWMEQLIPEIKAGGSPREVLLKFARTNNVAPALLEKLAHVYNTAKTLRFLEKSPDRGATFPVLDAAALVHDYTQSMPVVRRFDPDGWTEGETSFKVASSETPVKVSPRFPHWDRPAVPALDEPAQPVLPVAKPVFKRAHQLAELEQFQQLLFELRETSREKVASIVDCFRSDPDLDFAAIESDYRLLHGEETASLFDLIAPHSKRALGAIKRAANAGAHRLVDDRREVFTLLDQLRETLGLLKTAGATRAETFDGTYLELARSLKKEGSIAELEAAYDNAQAEGPSDAPVLHSPYDGGAEGEPSERIEMPVQPRPMSTGGKDTLPEPPDVADEIARLFESRTGGGRPLVPAPALDRIIRLPERGYNHGQEKVDTGFKNLETQVVLERLLMTDPVISEADEHRVVSLANSIRQQSPEIARDINAMRSVLREALQYDSLPIHTFKDLAATQKTVAERAKLDREQAQGAYGARKPAKREAA